MSAGLRQGRNPLSYLGVDATTPPMMIVEQRDPTDNDYSGYEVGSLWLVTSVPKMWVMVNKNPSAADKWVQVYPGDGSGTNFFETNSGTAAENAGTIKIKGSTGGILTSMSLLDQVTLDLDDDVVIVNSLTVNTMSEGVVVADSAGLLSSATGTDLQFLVGETGNAPSFATLVSENFTVTIANGTVPGTVNIQAAGGGGGSGFAGLIGENSVVATPSAEKVSVLGDEFIADISNIYTEASGNQINIFHSDMLNLGATNSTGRSGVIKLNGNIYFSAYGSNNLFLGKESGSLSLNIISAENNVGIGTYVLRDVDTSLNNTAVGYNSLASLDSGDGGNCCLGYNTGSGIQTGENNILIGSGAGSEFTSDESNNILLNADGSSGLQGATIIGNLYTNNCYISGIYDSTGLGATHGVVLVDNQEKLVSSKGTTGQVLTSTSTGVTWASSTPPSGSRSYGVYYKFSVNQTDLLEHYMGAEKIVTPYFSDTSAFYVGDGVGTPAKYTAQAAGLYYAFYSFYKSSSFNRYFTVHKTFSDFWDAKPTTPTHSSSTFLEQFYVMDVGDELTFSYRIDYVWLTGDIEVNYWVYYLGPLT